MTKGTARGSISARTEVYEENGEWKEDLRDGKGTHYFENGDFYTGEWRADYINGK